MPNSNTRSSERLVASLRNHLRVPLYLNGYALVFNSGATSLIGVAYWWLAARLYSIESVGRSSATIAVLMFLSGLSGLNMESILIRFVPGTGRAGIQLIAIVYLTCSIVAALISLVFLIGVDFWAPGLDFLRASPAIMVVFIFAVITGCLFALQDGAITSLRQARWVVVKNTLFALIKLALLVLLAYLLPIYGILVSWVAPVIFLTPIINTLIFQRLVPAHSRSNFDPLKRITLKQIVKSGVSNYLGFMFYQAYMMIPPIIVLGQQGAEASAHFYLPWLLYTSLRLLSVNMTTSLIVEGSIERAKLKEYSWQTLLKTAQLLIPAAFFLFVAAPFLLSAFGNEYAKEGTALLRWLVISTLPHLLVSLYLSVSWLQNRFYRIAAVQGAFALLSLSFSFVLLKSYKIAGVGIAWAISQTVLALVILLCQSREVIWFWRLVFHPKGLSKWAD
jgi:O-antigen/teichoic acid export membrane protein